MGESRLEFAGLPGANFFKQTPAREAQEDGVKISSVTQSEEELQAAASRNWRRRASRAAEKAVCTTVGPSLILPDGGTEHGEIKTWRGSPADEPEVSEHLAPQRSPTPYEFNDMIGPMTTEQAWQVQENFDRRAERERIARPDYQETIANGTAQLHNTLLRFVLNLHNAPEVQRYLLRHPIECEKANALASKGFIRQAEMQIDKISGSLEADPSTGMDHDSYRDYRIKRDKQIRSRV